MYSTFRVGLIAQHENMIIIFTNFKTFNWPTVKKQVEI